MHTVRKRLLRNPGPNIRYTGECIYDFDPKIENFGIVDPEIGNWNLLSRALSRDLWVDKVFLVCVTIKK